MFLRNIYEKEIERLRCLVKKKCCELENAGGLELSELYSINSPGVLFETVPGVMTPEYVSNNGYTVNTVGGLRSLVFQVRTPDGLPRTVSSAGGAVFVSVGNITLANAGTSVSIGVQDVNTGTGLPDGVFDVSAVWTSAAPPAGFTVHKVLMTSGTKTLNNGDLIAVVLRMTARGGVDAITVNARLTSVPASFPYGTTEASKSQPAPKFGILCDDGTVLAPDLVSGTFSGANAFYTVGAASNPREVGMYFTPPVSGDITQVTFRGLETNADTVTCTLYSNISSSPAAQGIATILGATQYGTWSYLRTFVFPTPVPVVAGTEYVLALAGPTSSVDLTVHSALTNALETKNLTQLGQNWGLARRADLVSAFTKVPAEMMEFAMYIR